MNEDTTKELIIPQILQKIEDLSAIARQFLMIQNPQVVIRPSETKALNGSTGVIHLALLVQKAGWRKAEECGEVARLIEETEKGLPGVCEKLEKAEELESE